ncbi:acyltransferase [Shimia sp.]|uniref:acyltransferase n=1 Tax=Shimia sp. TaxID=1954381 RepID=UPI003BAD518C
MVAEGQLANRHTWIDAMRLFAGLSMVGLHVTADAHGQPFPDATPSERVAPMLIRAVLYTARTELFLMISIFLLLMALERRPRGYGATIKEQARRLLVPFVFWTVFFAFYGLIKADALGYFSPEWAELAAWQSWVGFLLLGNVKYHMHFIPTLFALLLFYPAYRAAEKAPIFGLFAVVFLLMKQVLDPVIFKIFWGADILPYIVRLAKVATYTGYGLAAAAILGLWRRSEAPEREGWLGPVLLFAVGLFAFKLVAISDVIVTGQWDFAYAPGFWADYLMPIALLFICMCLGHRAWPGWISKVAKYTFGIYLCHPIFLDLAEVALKDSHLPPIALIGLEFLWTLPMTLAFVWLLGRSRWLGWTIGLGRFPQISRAVRSQPI